jgi:Leucine-rich repeat (LRR) protein
MTKKSSPKDNSQAGTGTFATARRFLTESRQYLIACTGAVAAFGGLQAAIAKFHFPSWCLWLAPALPLLVFLFKTVPRWRRERLERILVQLSQHSDATSPSVTDSFDGYFLIGPYPEERRRPFRRADGMHKTVLRWVRQSWLSQSRECVLVLTGNSGTGKSSLLQAFVIPELREGTPPCTILLVRSFEDTFTELRRRLAEPGVIWSEPPADLRTLTWDKLLPRAVEELRHKRPDARLVVVLDQFEEFVILDPAGSGTPRVTAMCDFLHGLCQQPPDGFTLLLALRSEYKMLLEPLGVPRLQQDVNWQEVPAFRQGDAAVFLSAPETGYQMSTERLHIVLTEAAAVDDTRGLIRPIVLNMLGVVLWRIAGGPEAERPTNTLLADDLRQVVNDSRHRDLARPILLRMLAEDADCKRPRTIRELAQETGFDPHAVDGCLLDLALSGYVRPVSRPDEITARVWEISHDFVARLLGPILKTPFQTLWQRAAEVLYPLALAAWVLLVIGAIVLGREREQLRVATAENVQYDAEKTLSSQFNFHIEKKGNSCKATQDSPNDFNSSQLAGAVAYFSKASPTTDLHLRGCKALRNVDALQNLKSLQTLDLGDCDALTNVDGLKDLKGLQTLFLGGCKALTSVDGLQDLKTLQTLDLTNCGALTNVDFLQELRSLQWLSLSGCKALTSVDILQELKNLQWLNLADCATLTNVNGLRELKSLQWLSLSGCKALTSVDVLHELKGLQNLNLGGCTALTSVGVLQELNGLQTLDLAYCGALTDVNALQNLKSLQTLDLGYCGALTNVDGLKELNNLQTLYLFNCRALTNVNGLKGLASLQTLKLDFCGALTNINGLKELRSLRWLDLYGCEALTSVDALQALKSLHRLDLGFCSALTNADVFQELKSLQTLNLGGCGALTNVDGLKELRSLSWLDLGNCGALTNVDGLKELKNLKNLNLVGCYKLSSESIGHLKQYLTSTDIKVK